MTSKQATESKIIPSLDEIKEAVNRPALPPIPVTVKPLDSSEQKILNIVNRLYHHPDSGINLLKKLVEINSFSGNREGIIQCGEIIRLLMEDMGFKTSVYEGAKQNTNKNSPNRGPHYYFERPGPGKKLLIMGHLDTVFHPNSGFSDFTVQGDRAFGPGVADMKGGLVVILITLRSLFESGLLDQLHLSVLFNGDEETGSQNSRHLIESIASKCDLGMEFEPGRTEPWGALIVARKGLGQIKITVHGRQAHAGNRPFDGLSAVHELSLKIVKIMELNAIEKGNTINVGIMTTAPGATRNTIADFAHAEIDLRYWDPEAGPEMEQKIKQIAMTPAIKNPWTEETVKIDYWSSLHRPAMAQSPVLQRWASKIIAYGELLKIPVGLTTVGGGSDANIASSMDLLTLAGFGPIGSKFHTPEEWVDLPSIIDRSQLFALTLNRMNNF